MKPRTRNQGESEQHELLRAVFSLDHRLRVFIPSTEDVTRAAKPEQVSELVKEALALFSGLFGGATKYDAMGAWQSVERNQTVVEQVVIVESYATKEAARDGLAAVMAFVDKLKSTLRQESVALEYDNRLYLI